MRKCRTVYDCLISRNALAYGGRLNRRLAPCRSLINRALRYENIAYGPKISDCLRFPAHDGICVERASGRRCWSARIGGLPHRGATDHSWTETPFLWLHWSCANDSVECQRSIRKMSIPLKSSNGLVHGIFSRERCCTGIRRIPKVSSSSTIAIRKLISYSRFCTTFRKQNMATALPSSALRTRRSGTVESLRTAAIFWESTMAASPAFAP